MDLTKTNNNQSDPLTLEICKISSVDELTRVWNDLAATASGCNKQDLLGALLGCISDGIVCVVSTEDSMVGFCCASPLNGQVLIQALPSGAAGQVCLGCIMAWAKSKGFTELSLMTDRLNGCNFRYLEKSLGFRRKSMLFTMTI